MFSAFHTLVPPLPATPSPKAAAAGFFLDTVGPARTASGLSAGHQCHLGALEGAAALPSKEHPAICNCSPRAEAPQTSGPMDRVPRPQLGMPRLHSVSPVPGV